MCSTKMATITVDPQYDHNPQTYLTNVQLSVMRLEKYWPNIIKLMDTMSFIWLWNQYFLMSLSEILTGMLSNDNPVSFYRLVDPTHAYYIISTCTLISHAAF